MSKTKEFPVACVIFWALVLALQIPAVREVYDRLFEAVTGMPVADPAHPKLEELLRKSATGKSNPWGFETPPGWDRTTGQPTR
jgi:hypothetical protein